MKIFYHNKECLHSPPYSFSIQGPIPYPEHPYRAIVVREALRVAGFTDFKETSRIATISELSEVHADDFLSLLSSSVDNKRYEYPLSYPSRELMQSMKRSRKGRHSAYATDIEAVLGGDSLDLALESAGCVLEAVDELTSRSLKHAFANIRPPGHHAGTDFFGGFCLANFAALATKQLAKFGRVALIDIDYHHGNGSEEILSGCDNIFFASLHAHPNNDYPYYSGWEEGSAHNVFNVPLPSRCTGEVYCEALTRTIVTLKNLGPDFIVVSAGVDSGRGDPVGDFELDSSDFFNIGKIISDLAKPTLIIQEGGYHRDLLGNYFQSLLSGFCLTKKE